MSKYEENKKWSTLQSWLFIFFLSGSLLGWAVIMMTQVEDVPREWDFGNLDYTPGASVFSTLPVKKDPDRMKLEWLELRSPYDTTRSGKLPDDLMVLPLPEGIPYKAEKSSESKEP